MVKKFKIIAAIVCVLLWVGLMLLSYLSYTSYGFIQFITSAFIIGVLVYILYRIARLVFYFVLKFWH